MNGLRLDGPGVGSEEAVMALQNTGDSVELTLSRRGRNPNLSEPQILQLKQFWEKIVGHKYEIIVS